MKGFALCVFYLIQVSEGALVPLTAYAEKSIWTESFPFYEWPTAEQYCRQEGMILAVLDPKEQAHLHLINPGETRRFWVATNQDGSPANYPAVCPYFDFDLGVILEKNCTEQEGVLCLCIHCNTWIYHGWILGRNRQ